MRCVACRRGCRPVRKHVFGCFLRPGAPLSPFWSPPHAFCFHVLLPYVQHSLCPHRWWPCNVFLCTWLRPRTSLRTPSARALRGRARTMAQRRGAASPSSPSTLAQSQAVSPFYSISTTARTTRRQPLALCAAHSRTRRGAHSCCPATLLHAVHKPRQACAARGERGAPPCAGAAAPWRPASTGGGRPGA